MADWGEMIAERVNKARERKRSEASEAQTLRKLMSLYEEGRKDEFATMGLADLRGESLAFAGKAAIAKDKREAAQADREGVKAERENQSASALQKLLGGFTQVTQRSQPNSTSQYFPDTKVGTQPMLNSANLRAALPQQPAAATGEAGRNLVDLMRVLQMGEATGDETGGDPRITEGPFGTKLVSDFRGRGTPQVVRDEKASTKFTVEPIIDRFGRAAGYGVKAQFTSEDEAKAWADQQNKVSGGAGGGKELDEATARALLKEAGGDKTKARALAKQRGYK